MTVPKKIDCFLIGHNQADFSRYEQSLAAMGTDSGAYRDLVLNFVRYNNNACSAADIFNMFCANHFYSDRRIEPLHPVETFSAAVSTLGTYLHNRGYTFDFITSFQDQKDYLAERLKRGEVLTVAITTTFYITALPIIQIIEFVRRHDPSVKIIVGGPFISTKDHALDGDEFNSLLCSIGADFSVSSTQGEASLVKILESIKQGRTSSSIPNVFAPQEGGGYRLTYRERESETLDHNMVNWDLFNGRTGPYVNVRTSISCPFACSFCGYPERAGEYRPAGLEAVERELDSLGRSEDIRLVNFIDDTFNVPPQRFKEILRLFIRKQYTFKWFSYYRCQFADRATVELMKASGCQLVFLGLESGDNGILTNMNKKTTTEQYLRGIALLKEYGIKTLGNFIIGFPGETEETVKRTIDFINTSGIDFYRAQLWYYEPITPIARRKEEFQMEGDCFEWSHKTMNSPQASQMIETLIGEIKEPVRLPQYYFDYDSLVYMNQKGMNWDEIKQFLKAFSIGVQEKRTKTGPQELSHDVVQAIVRSCHKETAKKTAGEKHTIEFNF